MPKTELQNHDLVNQAITNKKTSSWAGRNKGETLGDKFKDYVSFHRNRLFGPQTAAPVHQNVS